MNKFLSQSFLFFLAGVAAAFLSLVLSVLLVSEAEQSEVILFGISLSLLVGVIIEEISKLMIVYFLNSILSLHFKNITYLLFAGLGFAFFEYLLINLDFYNFDLKENFLNYFPALLIHLTTFVIIGLGFLAALKKSRFVYYIFPLIFTSISVIIHIAFNSIAIIYNL